MLAVGWMPEHTTRTAQRTTAVHSPELVKRAVTLGCHEVTKAGVSMEKVSAKVGDEQGAVLSPTHISEGAQAPEAHEDPQMSHVALILHQVPANPLVRAGKAAFPRSPLSPGSPSSTRG